MSWHFSQALAAAYSEANSSGGLPSAPSRSTTTPAESSWPDRTTDALSRSRSGTTLPPSTAAHGVDWWMSYLADSRAKTSALLARETDWRASGAVSGSKCGASSGKFDPVTSSWKTAQLSLFGGSEPCSEIWPRWGMMRDGEFWALTTPAHLISAIESGSWPTPNVCGGGNPPTLLKPKGNHFIRRSGKKAQLSLDQAVKLVAVGAIPTPRASTGKHGIAWCRAESGEHRHNLEDWLGTLWLKEGNQRIAGMNVNPDWQDWLMGWPIGHTDLAALATDKFQQWCASHGISFQAPTTNEINHQTTEVAP